MSIRPEKALAGVSDNLTPNELEEIRKIALQNKEDISSLENNVNIIDVYVGEDGNLHFVDATGADSVLPFKKSGRLIDLGTSTSYDIKTLLPDVDYTHLTVDDFIILANVSNSSTSASVYDYPDSGSLSSSSCSYTRYVSYDPSTGVLTAYSKLYITTHTQHNSTATNTVTVKSTVYYKENIEIA